MYQQKRKPQSNLRTSQPCASLVKAIAHTRMSVNTIASKQPFSVTGLCGVKLVLTPQQSGLVTDSDAEREREIQSTEKFWVQLGFEPKTFWIAVHSNKILNLVFEQDGILSHNHFATVCSTISQYRRNATTNQDVVCLLCILGKLSRVGCSSQTVYMDMLYRSSRDS